jgi:hypothetical protein
MISLFDIENEKLKQPSLLRLLRGVMQNFSKLSLQFFIGLFEQDLQIIFFSSLPSARIFNTTSVEIITEQSRIVY